MDGEDRFGRLLRGISWGALATSLAIAAPACSPAWLAASPGGAASPLCAVAGVAAPLFGAGGALIGCLGITMPSRRFDLHDRKSMTAAVRDAAHELSQLIALQN